MVRGSRTVAHMRTTLLYEGRLIVKLVSARTLRQYMKFRGYTVRSLADKAGVARGTIGWLTSGKRRTTSPETAIAISKALDCPVGALFSPEVVHGSGTRSAA